MSKILFISLFLSFSLQGNILLIYYYVCFNLLFEYFANMQYRFLFVQKLIIFAGKESVEGHSRTCS